MKAEITTKDGIKQVYHVSIKNIEKLKVKYGSKIKILKENNHWRSIK